MSQEYENVKVTVIMPSYNVGNYIEECLTSVRNQSLKQLEILCVDAGSTDNTIEIIKKHAALDERIKLVHSERKSYGYQVNLGIRTATGETIAIIDTDDYLETDAFEKLYHRLITEKLDMVKCNFSSFIEIHGVRYFVPELVVPKRLEEEVCDKIIEPHKYPFLFELPEYIWNGLYSRKFLIDHHIRLNESNGAAFQDKGMFVQTLYYAKRMKFVDESYYRYRRGSVTASVHDTKAIDNVTGEFSYVFDFLRTKPDAKDIRTAYFWKMLNYMGNFQQIFYRPFYVEGLEKNFDSINSIVSQVEKDGINRFGYNYVIRFTYNLLRESKEKYVEYQKTRAMQFIEEYRCWLEFLKDKRVVIFGAGDVGKQLYIFLTLNGIHVGCMCDNDDALWSTSFGECEIHSPNLEVKNPDNYYIIANRRYNNFIAVQLQEMGVSQEQMELYKSPLYVTMSICTI